MVEVKRPASPEPPILRAALIPASLLVAVVLYYGLGAPFAAILASTAPFWALFIAAPFWARASTRSFDRDALALLATKQVDELERRYKGAIGMRLFGAPAFVAERRGLVASERGRPEEARDAYKKAIKGWDDVPPPPGVLLGYAHACYALSDDEEAIRVYREIVKRAGSLPRVRRQLAHALVRAGRDLDDAVAMLELERKAAGDDAELDALLSQAKKARKRAKKAKSA